MSLPERVTHHGPRWGQRNDHSRRETVLPSSAIVFFVPSGCPEYKTLDGWWVLVVPKAVRKGTSEGLRTALVLRMVSPRPHNATVCLNYQRTAGQGCPAAVFVAGGRKRDAV